MDQMGSLEIFLISSYKIQAIKILWNLTIQQGLSFRELRTQPKKHCYISFIIFIIAHS